VFTIVNTGVKRIPSKAQAGTSAQSSLTRLVQSGRCEAVNSKKYQAELTGLVSRTSGEVDLKSKAEVFKALSEELRLKMVYLLLTREMCECEIIVALDLTQPTASHHLSILERAGLITKTKRGKWVFYKTSEANVGKFLGSAAIRINGRRLDLQVQGTR
jgi:DNA-binding transcriptional ArsR family regulator